VGGSAVVPVSSHLCIGVAMVVVKRESRGSVDRAHLSFAKPGRRQVVDLSALIRTQSRPDVQSLAPPDSALSLPLRRPSPARPREPGLVPSARRLQANGDSATTTQD